MPNKLDWRKLADYEFTQDLTLDEWAWEFLRRCPEYRQEWARLCSSHTILCGMILKDCKEKWGLRRGYLDPEINFTNIEFVPPGGGKFNPYHNPGYKSKGLILMTGTKEVFYKFDVRLPIMPQLENAKKELKACQEKTQHGVKTS